MLALVLGAFTLLSVGFLLIWDAFPQRFPPGSHDLLAAFPLATIAFAYLIYRRAHRSSIGEWVRAGILASAFLFWAANQLWPALPQAILFNDLAIGLFVVDVFLAMMGWPASSQRSLSTVPVEADVR